MQLHTRQSEKTKDMENEKEGTDEIIVGTLVSNESESIELSLRNDSSRCRQFKHQSERGKRLEEEGRG